MIKKENKVLQKMREGYIKKLKKATGFDSKKNPKIEKILKDIIKK